MGGRVANESKLPGLSSWGRVVDYRVDALNRLETVEIYRESRLEVQDVFDLGVEHVFVATGSHWRNDGLGRALRQPLTGLENIEVFTPDQVMAGAVLPSPVLLFDDDHYYMGNVLAELLVAQDIEVIFVTPAPDVATWTHNTLEQHRIQRRLLELNVTILASHSLLTVTPEGVMACCVYTGRPRLVEAAAMLLVTSREPEQGLHDALNAQPQALVEAGIQTVAMLGDCLAPGTIAAAVYSGHRMAREFDVPVPERAMQREIPALYMP